MATMPAFVLADFARYTLAYIAARPLLVLAVVEAVTLLVLLAGVKVLIALNPDVTAPAPEPPHVDDRRIHALVHTNRVPFPSVPAVSSPAGQPAERA